MHILVVPKKHIKNIDYLTRESVPLVQNMKEVAI
jgi:diadenosine tetraphosphate (Ap4A) HIT family hydrolase